MPSGIPKDPNWKPRKQKKGHPFNRQIIPSSYKDTKDEFFKINESDFSDYSPTR